MAFSIDALLCERISLETLVEKYETDIQKLVVERREIIKEAKSEAKEILSHSNASIENAIHEIKKVQAEKERTKEVRRQIDDLKKRLSCVLPKSTVAGDVEQIFVHVYVVGANNVLRIAYDIGRDADFACYFNCKRTAWSAYRQLKQRLHKIAVVEHCSVDNAIGFVCKIL
jgi:seryl-tRNA synthetase